jgi:hypothetical protein
MFALAIHHFGRLPTISRVDGFDIIHLLSNDGPLNAELAVKPVYVRPFESKAFADAKAKETQTSASVRAGSSQCSTNRWSSSTSNCEVYEFSGLPL